MQKKQDINISDLANFIVSRLSDNEKEELIHQIQTSDTKTVPLSLFKNKLSSLELTVRYLKEKSLDFNEISKLLNRKYTTISSTYYKSLTKLKKLKIQFSKYHIPLRILKKSRLSILEAIVKWLSDEHKLSTPAISELLSRSQSTIRTVLMRANKKT